MDPSSRPLWIGEFRVDAAAQRLWRNDVPIDLVPQVWALLHCLIERQGQLVTKDQILRAAWPGVAVSDMALSQAVRRLRMAFGDDARTPRYIETAHRRGFRLVAPLRFEPPPQDTAGEHTLFVGRSSERRTLAALLEAARGDARQIVFLEGEAGIGKTALLRWFLAEQWGQGVRVADAQCVEHQGTMEPYMPVLEALDRLVRTHPRSREVMRHYAPTWLAQMPWLLEREEAHGLRSVLTETTRGRMLREMTRALEALAEDVPLVLVLEDLHWADRATLDLLGSIARRRDPAKLVVVGTYRAAEAIAYQHPIVGMVRALGTGSACTRIALASLPPDEVEAYLSRRFSVPRLAATLAMPIHARSEGNPLFMVAMVDHLVERGFLAERSGRWKLVRPVEENDLREIPNSLREMIELQLVSLETGELELLQAASVAAVEFRSASVAAALDQPGAAGVEAIESACDRLIARRHFLHPAGHQTWPDGTSTATYSFRHQLYRQTLYERLPAGRRQKLHQRIGERLEAGFASDPRRVASEIASHFDHSGDDAKAMAYYVLAARQAHRRFADREAARFLGAALAHIDGLPADEQRDRNEIEIRVAILLAHWLAELELPEEDDRHLARIQKLVSASAFGVGEFQLCSRLWNIYTFRSHPDLAAPFADRMLADAAGSEPARLMEACVSKGMTCLMQGQFTAGVEFLQRALDTFGDGEPPKCAGFPDYETRWEEAGTRIHSFLGTGLFLVGQLDRASSHIDRGIELGTGRVHPKLGAATLLSSAGIYCVLGEVDIARAYSDRGIGLAEEHSLTSLREASAAQRAWLATQKGSRRGASALLRDAWQCYLRSRTANPAALSPILLADACRMARLVDLGLEVVETVWQFTRTTGLRWYDAELQRLKGELILLRGGKGAVAEASRCLRGALEIARGQNARFYELRAATSLARLCRGGPDEREAVAILDRVYAGFTAGRPRPDLEMAASYLQAG